MARTLVYLVGFVGGLVFLWAVAFDERVQLLVWQWLRSFRNFVTFT